MFYENYLELCSKRGKSKTAVAKEIGLVSKSVTGWKNGAIPRNGTLKKLADYFGITVEELMKEENPAGQGGIGFEWPEVDAAFKNATPEARAAAKAAALAVLESGKK